MTRLFVVCVVGLVSLAVAPGARAGEYHVYACRTPSGESAPVDGWSGSVAPGGAYDDYTTDTCAGGGALVAALGEETTHVADVDEATWAFSVPAGETMVGATLWRAGDADGGEATNATYELWLAGPSESVDVGFDTAAVSNGEHHLVVSVLDAAVSYPVEFVGPGRWQLRVLCEAQAGYPFAAGWSNVVGVRVV